MSAASPLPDALCRALRAALNDDDLLLSPTDRIAYGSDNSRREALPDAVVLPCDAKQVLAIVRACAAHRVPLIARGRGTNTTGATVPVHGGVVCSLERMNQILEIDPANRLAVVEPGVLNGDLQNALDAHGFFWAPDPTSAPFSTIGGNLACNAGGPRAVKYGACRDNVLGLEAVTGRGELIRTGSRTSKGSVGYDLTRLLVGSEGTLGIITQATLKILPKPESIGTALALFADVQDAAHAVSMMMAQADTPRTIEFMDARSIELARDFGGAAIDNAAKALLLIEVDGDAEMVRQSLLNAIDIANKNHALLAQAASDAQEVESLWRARKALSPAQRHVAPDKINEDVVVPVSRLPELVSAAAQLRASSGLEVICFGHAGSGNLHVNVLHDRTDESQQRRADHAIANLFDAVIGLQGTLSGEHGIGLAKLPFMRKALGDATVDTMHALRATFDPNGILNPGKLLP